MQYGIIFGYFLSVYVSTTSDGISNHRENKITWMCQELLRVQQMKRQTSNACNKLKLTKPKLTIHLINQRASQTESNL
jgi:hypothetical protein